MASRLSLRRRGRQSRRARIIRVPVRRQRQRRDTCHGAMRAARLVWRRDRARRCWRPAAAAAQAAPAARRPRTAPSSTSAACAQCHDAGVGRAPNREQFRSMSPDRVLSAMETGSMVTMATNRTRRRAARHRRVPDRQDVRHGAHHDAGAAGDVHGRGNAPFAPGTGPRVERLGQRHRRTPASRRRQGRPDGGRRAAS